MRHERQLALLERLTTVDDQQTALFGEASVVQPSTAYTDPQRFERERDLLFRNGPVLIGLSSECSLPGAYLTGRFGGIPIAVIRQADGSLVGVINACRHRGAPLLEGSGEGLARISCGWHAWAYRTDGTLHSRPLSDGAFDDVTMNCDLRRVAVGEAHGMIFVRPNSTEAIDIGAYLRGATDDLDSFGLDRCVHVESRTKIWNANWKLLLDTFTESYHIRTLHKKTLASYFFSGCTIFEPFGPHQVNIGLRKAVFDEKAKPPAEQQLISHGTFQYFLMPNAMLCYQTDHFELWRFEPLDVRTTQVTTSVFANDGPVSEKTERYLVKNLDLLLNVTGNEDFELIERVQANLDSGALPELVYGRIEPSLVHFHREIDRALANGGLNS